MSVLLATPFMVHSMEENPKKRNFPFEQVQQPAKVQKIHENQRKGNDQQTYFVDSTPTALFPYNAQPAPLIPGGYYSFPPFLSQSYAHGQFEKGEYSADTQEPLTMCSTTIPWLQNQEYEQHNFDDFEQYDFCALNNPVSIPTTSTTFVPESSLQQYNTSYAQQSLVSEEEVVEQFQENSGRLRFCYSELMERLEITDWMNMDPGAEFFQNGNCAFKQIRNHLTKGSPFYKILYDIVHEDYSIMESFGTTVTQDNIAISRAYVEDKLNKAIDYLNNLENTDDQLKEEVWSIMFKVISLRFVKEIRDKEYPFPMIKISATDRQADFKELCRYKGSFKEQDNGDFIGASTTANKTGMKASGHFIDHHRYKVAKTEGKKVILSPWNVFNSFKLVGHISSEIMSNHKKAVEPKQKANKIASAKKANVSTKRTPRRTPGRQIYLDNVKLKNKLMRDMGASQFRPTYVKDVLEFLKSKEYNISRMCDFCTGWGDRLFGNVASIVDYGITQYLGTDPNTELHEDYIKLCENYTPVGYKACKSENCSEYIDITYEHSNPELQISPFKARIYKKPAEELKDIDLKLGERQADLELTSIPYFNKELYPDTNKTQSHVRYKSYEAWKEGFLLPFIDQSVKAVRIGGIIAINSAPVHKEQKQKEDNITADLEKMLDEYENNGITLKKVANFWYNGKPNSNTLIYEVVKKEGSEEKKEEQEEEITFQTTDCRLYEENDDLSFLLND